MNNESHDIDARRDQLTGAQGAHAVGAGVGALDGGLDGTGVAEAVDPTRARANCSKDVSGSDCVEHGSSFGDCGPAYGFGVSARGRYPGRDFDDVESEMARDWAGSRGASILSWEWARHAARDAWHRISPSRRLCV